MSEADVDESTFKTCIKCGRAKPLSDFHRQASKSDGRRPDCKTCRAAYRTARRRMTEAEKQAIRDEPVRRTRKVCTKCGVEKPLGEYPMRPRNADGRLARCRECQREYMADYYAVNRTAIRAKNQARYVASRDEVAARGKQSRAEAADRLAFRRHLRALWAAEVGEQKCRTCKQVLHVLNFHRDGNTSNGRSGQCKNCSNEAGRKWYAANIDHVAEYNRQWRATNRHLHNELSRRWYYANQDRATATARAWKEANGERIAEARRRWLERNPTYYRDWASANRDRTRVYSDRYRRANLELFAEAARRRRALERGVSVGEVNLDELWDGFCNLCQEPLDRSIAWPDPLSKSLDHIIPISRGGLHQQDNLAWTHLVCNMRKGARITT